MNRADLDQPVHDRQLDADHVPGPVSAPTVA